MAKSRRKGREAALRTLYEIEVGRTPVADALTTLAEAQIDPIQEAYAVRLVNGLVEHGEGIDHDLAPLVRDYDYFRLAVIDRNLIRIAAYELAFVPEVPAAVSINEAIEISKKFSTQESGRFINGVVGKYLQLHPKLVVEVEEVQAEEPAPEEPETEVEEQTVEADTPEAEQARKLGRWTVKTPAESSMDQ